jgi:hypothetical protein
MPMVIRCECGQVVHGDDERRLVEAARRHIGERHPDLVDRFSDDDLRRMAEPGERA